jgi:hypothetical protein
MSVQTPFLPTDSAEDPKNMLKLNEVTKWTKKKNNKVSKKDEGFIWTN